MEHLRFPVRPLILHQRRHLLERRARRVVCHDDGGRGRGLQGTVLGHSLHFLFGITMQVKTMHDNVDDYDPRSSSEKGRNQTVLVADIWFFALALVSASSVPDVSVSLADLVDVKTVGVG